MKLYKLTNRDCRCRAGFQWGAGVTQTMTREVKTVNAFHAFEHPILAALLDDGAIRWHPRSVGGEPLRLWESHGEVSGQDLPFINCRRLTTTREIPLVRIDPEARVQFAILCALKVFADPVFQDWANNWLNGTDRSDDSAERTRKAAEGAESEAIQAAEPKQMLKDVGNMAAASAAVHCARAAYGAYLSRQFHGWAKEASGIWAGRVAEAVSATGIMAIRSGEISCSETIEIAERVLASTK